LFPLLRRMQALGNVHGTFRELTQNNRCAYFVYIPCVTATLHCPFSYGFPPSQRRSRGLVLHKWHAMGHTHSALLSGPSQSLHLIKHNIQKSHPWFRWDSNPQSQQARAADPRGALHSVARGGGHARYGDMSYPQWEHKVEVSQRQHSLHQCLPKEVCVTDHLVNGNVISSIHCAYSHSRAQQVTAHCSIILRYLSVNSHVGLFDQ